MTNKDFQFLLIYTSKKNILITVNPPIQNLKDFEYVNQFLFKITKGYN